MRWREQIVRSRARDREGSRTGQRACARSMKRQTIVVEGPLAFRMRRLAAAGLAEAGVQIMTLPQLAARLVGGFARPARSNDLDPAIRSALEAGSLIDLEPLRELPGMTRSVASTLSRV
jgi:hypothetical protein